MYMRLAFSVAAHLDPEILLVDEVLAVGDAIFQRKCINKMSAAAGGGRTVLFVSHNIPAVAGFCQRAFLLEGGKIAMSGPVQEVAGHYLSQVAAAAANSDLSARKDRTGSGVLRLTGFRIQDASGKTITQARNGQDVCFIFGYSSPSGVGAENVNLQFVLLKQSGEALAQFGTRFAGGQFSRVPPRGEIHLKIKRLPLVPDIYRLDAYLSAGLVPADYVFWLAQVNIVDGDFYGSGYQVFEKESKFLLDGSVELRES
jgi:lipopolysaccharide transport system ATP-binding protein